MALPATTYYVDVAVEDATIAPSYYRLMHVSRHMNVWVYPLELSGPTYVVTASSAAPQACISWRLPRFLVFITNLDDRFRSRQSDCSLPLRNLLNFLRGFPSVQYLPCCASWQEGDIHVKLGIVD